ncbi:MAG: nitrophenyl compound nitroreductase subunit ArsF family protein, partial [Chloroflexi bacterium]|nr:nitrophenyl compound nitroreductase subunit ArsF family protein [Chloroflexota bacterium]
MAYSIKSLILSLSLAGIVLLAGCSGSPSSTAPPAAPTPAQTPSQPTSGQNPAPGTLPNRIDVIYFHVNQRCVTCLCFEQQVNHVIEAYFGDAINSGKLTYRVLNLQKAENTAIARKYGAVGSQLFINTVVKGVDHIEDIQDIWNWNCRNNKPGFDLKVRSVI